MNKMNKIWLIAFVMFFGVVSCDTKDELLEERLAQLPQGETQTAGSADFSKYVAVGNSTSAGFMDGALYNLGQSNSFPNLLAQQFTLVGGGAFNQPDINSENGFNQFQFTETPFVDGRFLLDTSIPGPVPTIGEAIGPFTGDKSALNNFAIPGARVIDLISPAYDANPFYARIASSPGMSTIIGDASAANSTFFTLWIGSNDVLGWAASGGTAPDAATAGSGSLLNPQTLTDETSFTNAYTAVLSAMANNGADGIVLNIPPILTLPFFQAVPYNAIPLDDATIIGQLNGAATQFNNALDGLVAIGQLTMAEADARKITYTYVEGSNPILIEDKFLNDLGDEFDALQGAGVIDAAQRAALVPLEQARLTRGRDAIPNVPADIVLFTAANELGTVVGGNPLFVRGVTVPLGDEFILLPQEQGQLEMRRAAFNIAISNAVTSINSTASGNIVLLDTTPTFNDLVGLDGTPIGISRFGGVTYAPDFSPNGIYSTDGIHPNPRGQAIVANVVIEAINENFNATIPLLDISVFPSVQLAQ